MHSTRLTLLILLLAVVAAASIASAQIPDMPPEPAEEVKTGHIPDVPPDDSGESVSDPATGSTTESGSSELPGETDAPVPYEPRRDAGPVTVPRTGSGDE